MPKGAKAAVAAPADASIPGPGRGFRRTGTESLSSALFARQSSAVRLVTSPLFDAVLGAVIMLNAILIGIEQQWDLDGKGTTLFGYIEHALLAVYVVELGLRAFAMGVDCLWENWWRFDAVLVVASVSCFWVIFPIWGDVAELESMAMLRMLRLLRLARAVRMLWLFRELWMLVHGLLVSGKTIVYTILLITAVLYLYAILAMELITSSTLAAGTAADSEFQEHTQLYFSSLPATMMTLLQFVSFDNVHMVYEPLIRRDWKLALVFLSMIVLVGVLLMNLVTAVIVNSALEQALADKEMAKAQEESQKKRLIKELRKVFTRLDDDGSGLVTRDEIERIQPEDREMLNQLLGVSDPIELFNALDADGSGEVDIDEFCTGVWAVCISKSPIELKRTEKMVEFIRDQLRSNRERMDAMMERIEALELRSEGKSSACCIGSEPTTPKTARSAASAKNRSHGGAGGAEKARDAAHLQDAPMPEGERQRSLQETMNRTMREMLIELMSDPCAAAAPTSAELLLGSPDLDRVPDQGSTSPAGAAGQGSEADACQRAPIAFVPSSRAPLALVRQGEREGEQAQPDPRLLAGAEVRHL